MAKATLRTGFAGAGCLVLVLGWWTLGHPSAEAGRAELVQASGDELIVRFTPPAGTAGELEAGIHRVDDNRLVAKVTLPHDGRTISVTFACHIGEGELADYYVRYRFASDREFEQKSLLFIREMLRVTVLGQRELVAGTHPTVRILVRDEAVGKPVEGAHVSVQLMSDDTAISEKSYTSDKQGEVLAVLETPDREVEQATLRVEVSTESSGEVVEQPVSIRSSVQTLLVTDKPLYQPGQTVHMRSLSLSRTDRRPVAEAEAVFEVEDAKGNKVFKRKATTDAYGVAHADFVLADEVNMGPYRIRAIVAGAKQEKTVTVDRYVLPKFKVDLTTDRKFYQPGDTVKGEIQVDYFFGKPVAGGKVAIACAKFDVEYVDFEQIEGKTDENGHYAFEVKLPEHFVGQPLEQGKASVKFEVKVTDTADHKETITRNVTVTNAPILIAAVPESGKLVPELENRVYVVTTYADGTPAEATVDVVSQPQAGGSAPIQTDEAGFGQFVLTPQEGETCTVTLAARDAQGHRGQVTVELEPQETPGRDTLILRTNKALFRVGDELAVSVVSTRKTGSVYVDLIKDRQTYLTKTLELRDGRAETRIGVDAGLSGTVQVSGYLIGRDGITTRDRRLVVVDPADDLAVEIGGDAESYLPGGEAKLTFRVKNKAGKGVASALGVMVVDEAVFALQEMQPGLEKVYFYLEKEIATPRHEIHGYNLEGCLRPMGTDEPPTHRDAAARVLLASAQGTGEHTLEVVQGEGEAGMSEFQARMLRLLMPKFQKITAEAWRLGQKQAERGGRAKRIDAELLIAEKYLTREELTDPWGTLMRVEMQANTENPWQRGFSLVSAGIDRQWDTVDDVEFPGPWARREGRMRGRFGGGGLFFGVERGMVVEDKLEAVRNAAMPMDAAEVKAATTAEPAPAIRVREYFPETLLFAPAVITDGGGLAELTVPLADSITTWRLTCMASSAAGELGSATAGIRVFQEFFVDIDFPVRLTQNDQVHVPVAIYNYLTEDQSIRLTVDREDWFELDGPAEKTVTLGPGEVTVTHFPITARRVGFRKFMVTARGTSRSDAVRRSVEVAPDGREVVVNHSGRLTGNLKHTIAVPPEAVDEASKIFVKVYPGILSQVVEGLDGMLRMPFGCFEQTSSVTYPNVLILDYMKATGKVTPELQMKAEGFINQGYQRLLSFEVDGGGFEWFGNPPAHKILTAYGLMEFVDMAEVYEVDPAVIQRTQRWLASCQEGDGSWKPSEGGIQEGAINQFTSDLLRNTAYITWALAATGSRGPEVEKGLSYIRNHLDDMKADVYTRVLVANALAAVAPDDKTTLDTLTTLHEMRIEKDGMVWWESQSATPTYGTGEAAHVETTGLAIQAMIRCGKHLDTVSNAVTYLAKTRDASGAWGSTQATVQALRAMLMAERDAGGTGSATVSVRINGKEAAVLTIDETNRDVLQLVDMADRTRDGDNEIELLVEGEAPLMYQAIGRYYMPHPKGPVLHGEEPMAIDLVYDRTALAADDVVNVTATVRNLRPVTARMVIVDLGLPPGFTLMPQKLDKLVEDKTIEKYSTTGRQIIIYLREVRPGQPIMIEYQLRAKYPLRAQAPVSTVYEYYNPQIRSTTAPMDLVVSDR
ncbi:MAG: hypothetical protein GXY33_21200 [Phycisphaerae bacterium]|nr:hypothetical protein [Phycisphaerae bacterium]